MRSTRWWLSIALGAVLLAGCLPDAPTPGDPSPSPVFAEDFPDPFVMRVGSTYYGYSTSGAHGNVQVTRTTDLVHWSWVGNGLTHVPSWADGPSVWAPAVVPRGSGYVMYYAANIHNTDKWCLSYATSSTPTGPFVDTTTSPFVCQMEHAGSGDPSTFVDSDGTAYLLWQSHGIPDVEPTFLWSAQLTADGRGLVPGTTHGLLMTSQWWQGNLIENPAMLHTPEGYFLFYSSNEWDKPWYTIGVARCDGPSGPCADIYGTGVLASRGAMLGPGGPAPIIAPDGTPKLVFHAWTDPLVGYQAGGKRRLYMLPITFNGNDPAVG